MTEEEAAVAVGAVRVDYEWIRVYLSLGHTVKVPASVRRLTM